MIIETLKSLDEIDKEEYNKFHYSTQSSLFYDWRFLSASEKSPLLSVIKTYYILVREKGCIIAILPLYLQNLNVVDPFGKLSANTHIINKNNDTGLFSHMMHCYETTLLSSEKSVVLYQKITDRMRELATVEKASYFGFLNTQDDFLLENADSVGLNVNFLMDSWYHEMAQYNSFNHLIIELSAKGRNEVRRQLRKFENSHCTLSMLSPPFDERLEQLAELCHQTTAKLGTPHYFPAKSLAEFTRECGDIVRLNLIECEGELISGAICLLQGKTLHLWSGGMDYEKIEFSPYTMVVVNAYRYAFAYGLEEIGNGRLNEKVKVRLGFKPRPLYAITSNRIGN